MEKIELEIINLSQHAAQNHSYAIILGEAGGVRRLPIIIGAFEAQAIAVALEKVIPSRPLTHDLIRNTLQLFEITLKEVLIDNLQEGVFYAKLVCQQKNELIEIDSRTSDAIALAVRFNCPIYTFEFILDQAGIVMDGEVENLKSLQKKAPSKPVKPAAKKDDLGSMTIDQLNQKLQEHLDNEEYEKAAAVRDELTKRE